MRGRPTGETPRVTGATRTVTFPLPSRRRYDVWDILGMLTAATGMLLVNQVVVALLGTDLGQVSQVAQVTVAVVAVTVAVALFVDLRDRPTLRQSVAGLARVWLDPPSGAVAFVLGVLLSVPLLGLLSPWLFNDSDSARVLALVRHFQHGGFDWLRDTQEPLLPQVTLGPALAVGGLPAVKLVAVLAVQTLAGTLAYVSYRLTGRMWAAFATVAALLCLSPVYERVVRLPMYTLMLSLATIGAWLTYRAMADGAWRCVVLAGVCLALAPEAHAVGQLALAVPPLLVLFAPTLRDAAWRLGAVYLVIATASLPRLLLNLSDGGLSHVTAYRTDYWITEGYVTEIQNRFWDYPAVREPAGEYLDLLPGRIYGTLGGAAWLVIALALVGWLVACRGRARLLPVAGLAFLVLAITLKPIPPFPRYYAPFWPVLALLAGVGVAALARRRLPFGRELAVAATVGLVVLAGVTHQAQVQVFEDLRDEVEVSVAEEVVGLITDGQGVIGARAHHFLLSPTADIATYGDQFLREDEFVTYLTWPSDAEVIALMQRHDIGWVFIHAARNLELAYHDTWLLPHHGERARHVDMIALSPYFCRVYDQGGYQLYSLGPCPDSAALGDDDIAKG